MALSCRSIRQLFEYSLLTHAVKTKHCKVNTQFHVPISRPDLICFRKRSSHGRLQNDNGRFCAWQIRRHIELKNNTRRVCSALRVAKRTGSPCAIGRHSHQRAEKRLQPDLHSRSHFYFLVQKLFKHFVLSLSRPLFPLCISHSLSLSLSFCKAQVCLFGLHQQRSICTENSVLVPWAKAPAFLLSSFPMDPC